MHRPKGRYRGLGLGGLGLLFGSECVGKFREVRVLELHFFVELVCLDVVGRCLCLLLSLLISLGKYIHSLLPHRSLAHVTQLWLPLRPQRHLLLLLLGHRTLGVLK